MHEWPNLVFDHGPRHPIPLWAGLDNFIRLLPDLDSHPLLEPVGPALQRVDTLAGIHPFAPDEPKCGRVGGIDGFKLEQVALKDVMHVQSLNSIASILYHS